MSERHVLDWQYCIVAPRCGGEAFHYAVRNIDKTLPANFSPQLKSTLLQHSALGAQSYHSIGIWPHIFDHSVRNFPGTSVLFHADFGSLPIQKKTGLVKALEQNLFDDRDGRKKPLGHMCGHDFDTTSLSRMPRPRSALGTHDGAL